MPRTQRTIQGIHYSVVRCPRLSGSPCGCGERGSLSPTSRMAPPAAFPPPCVVRGTGQSTAASRGTRCALGRRKGRKEAERSPASGVLPSPPTARGSHTRAGLPGNQAINDAPRLQIWTSVGTPGGNRGGHGGRAGVPHPRAPPLRPTLPRPRVQPGDSHPHASTPPSPLATPPPSHRSEALQWWRGSRLVRDGDGAALSWSWAAADG